LVFTDFYGPQSGAHRGHDRKLSLGLIWKLFMSNPEISGMLDRVGFKLGRTEFVVRGGSAIANFGSLQLLHFLAN